MKLGTLALCCCIFVVYIQPTQSYFHKDIIWACGKHIGVELARACSPAMMKATIFAKIRRIQLKYSKNKYSSIGSSNRATRSINELKRYQSDTERFYTNNLKTIQRHSGSKNVRRRLKKRGISRDCCTSPCKLDYVQKHYCPPFMQTLKAQGRRRQ